MNVTMTEIAAAHMLMQSDREKKALAAEVERLAAEVKAQKAVAGEYRTALAETRQQSNNWEIEVEQLRAEVERLQVETNRTLAERNREHLANFLRVCAERIEVTRQRDELREICIRLIDYRKRNTLNFQLEKLDDFIHQLRVALEPPSVTTTGQADSAGKD